jgi:hypothetical protein
MDIREWRMCISPWSRKCQADFPQMIQVQDFLKMWWNVAMSIRRFLAKRCGMLYFRKASQPAVRRVFRSFVDSLHA